MSSEDNKALVRRFFDEVVNGGNIDLIDELLTDDFVEHEKFPGLEPNRDGVKEFFRRFRSSGSETACTANRAARGSPGTSWRSSSRNTERQPGSRTTMGMPASSRGPSTSSTRWSARFACSSIP